MKRLQLFASTKRKAFFEVVFDPVNELLYVGCTETDAAPPQVLALNARDLTVRWRYVTNFAPPNFPLLALNGTQLCFADKQNILYMFDTRDALAQADGGDGGSPKPSWRCQLPVPTDGTPYGIVRPMLTNGQVYAAMWGWADGPSTLYLAQCNADDGGNPQLKKISDGQQTPFTTNAPLLGRVRAEDQSEPQALYIVGMDTVYAVNIESDAEPVNSSFKLPAGGAIFTGLAYDDGTRLGQGLSSKPDFSRIRIWFGDLNGGLWALNDELDADGPVWQAPHDDPEKPVYISSTPVIYKDPQGGATVLFGVWDEAGSNPALYGYDPVTRTAGSIPTGTTFIFAVAPTVINGVIYAGGAKTSDVADASLPPQLFGIRVDELPQALRSFVIESQLMQDPDQNAAASGSADPNNPIPPSMARYQTHLTVLNGGSGDPNKFVPRPDEPVKVWADKSGTAITIDTATGPQKFTVGPGDDDYAAVTTGTDGSLVIVSDAKDMFASPLRVWASFMDPYERVVVNPDQEYHSRVTTAHADATDDDPDKVNLTTAHNYKGDPLFTEDEKNQGQPQNCADAVGQMNKGVGFGEGSKSSHANILRVMRGERPATGTALRAAGPEPYLAYADLTGASHFPTNIPAYRPAGIVTHVGLSYSRPPQGDKASPTPPPPGYKTLSHSEALDLIDQLEGKSWSPPSQSSSAAAQPKGDIWSDFWNWLTGWVQDAVNYITDVVVAVAEDIVVGIRMIINGVAQVFNAIIRAVEDIAAAIGSFFQMLVKLIEDVIAALSVLFHFGEIIKTHNWVKDRLAAQVTNVKNAITEYILPDLDKFFDQGEEAIKNFFNELRNQIKSAPRSGFADPSSSFQLNNLPGSGSTAHTAFTAKAGGIGPDSGGSSHAVQATWGHQKLKSGLPAAQAVSCSIASSRASVADPISDFLNGFFNRITGDGDLSATFSQLKTDIGHLFQPNSASDFFATLLDTLLDILELLLEGVLAVGQAFVGGTDKTTGKPYGLLSLAGNLIDALMTLLTETIEIPVLSWLYKLLFNEDLTFLNAITLVAAIPVTMLYRVVEGRYPSADLGLNAAGHAEQRADVPPITVVKKVQGAFGAMIALVLGVTRAVGDAARNPPWKVTERDLPTGLSLACGLIYSVMYFPLLGNDPSKVGPLAWACWGMGLAITLLGVVPVFVPNPVWKDIGGLVFSVIRSYLMAFPLLIMFIVAFAMTGNKDATAQVAFARNFFLPLAPMFNYLVWMNVDPGPETPILVGIVVVLDVLAGVAVCALNCVLAFAPLKQEAWVNPQSAAPPQLG